ncbi:MAG: amidohydrolase family protein [Alphaproteobacteria bacterium]|nr:amidohydrolase family protein [Alphaproteobacteria bacterium]
MSARLSRRTLITSGLAGAALAPSTGWAKANYGAPDAIVLARKIHSMSSDFGTIEALAIRGDRILAVGDHADMRDLATSRTRVIDARDAVVTPGFIDSHSHPLSANEAISVNVDLRTIAEIQAALKARAEKTPPGEWVIGHAYDDTKLAGGRPVLRRDLDEVSTEHPILITHRGGHTGVGNSKAFEAAGVTAQTPDPDGGKFYRDADGLTGRVAERGLYRLRGVETYPQSDRASNQENARISSRRMAAAGLTSVTDAGCGTEEYVAYLDALHAGDLSVRVSAMPRSRPDRDGAPSLYERFKAAGYRSGDGGHEVRIGAVKYGADGSASERTMRMSTPYVGRPGDYGILTMSQAEIDEAVDDALANGFRIGIHANGDVTIDMVLNAYERALKGWRGTNPRLRIEHCSLVTPELLKRIKAIGAIPTPFYTYAHYHGNKWVEYGEEKMRSMFAHKSFLDYGIPVAPASDYLPGPYEPMMALQSLVTRKDFDGRVWGPNQRISVEAALRICTVNGAYASFEEDVKGAVTPGRFADLAFLGDDPLEVDPEALKEIKVLRTMKGGQITHEA